ncbi:putative exocyst complex component Sec3 [Talaromyces proteolyticus]|uniref:Exocyst complex component Sec3 n=1 Tax=Talaromyces proteolyticus TaxID=1131652 RepID=A0AAD4Q068_9EURO|nr:putative exocyst complex component Sec3 [Talaromyces proteolyticus]KAH8700504.1 putative exocyst complex component Sec3 [Talaromyces proteolyticus]
MSGPPPRGYDAAGPRARRPAGEDRDDGKLGAGEGSMSRAQMFQDEKRRIVSSCFSKQDSDGALTESYITHIRITEDAAYPSTPAPPNSPPENKKPRLIIVALRKSGRVRMHKARENNDGTFSIGKTWMLDDLSAIQSYSDLPANTQVEQQHKQWASNVGFVITVGKPYYWQASNFKERDFFIASLVKIYKKYTGGRAPKLIGFDEKQKQTLIGDASQGPLRTEPPTKAAVPPLQEPSPNRAPSRERLREPRSTPSPRRPPPLAGRDGPPSKINGRIENDQVAAKSQLEQMADLAGRQALESPEPLRTMSRGRDESPANIRPVGRAPPSRDGRDGSESKMNRSLDVTQRPTTAGSGTASSMHGASGSLGQSFVNESNGRLSRPTSRGEAGSVPPSRGSDRSNRSSRNVEDVPPSLRPGSANSLSLKIPVEPLKAAPEPTNAVPEPAPIIEKGEESPVLPIQKPADTAYPATIAVEQAEPVLVPPQPGSVPEAPTSGPPPDPADSSESHRPGLGPMIKKKSTKDIAGAFRKAATAYSAFKPRPGGAGERLMAKPKTQTNEPDGITGVVPAPLLRGQSSESTKPTSTTGIPQPPQETQVSGAAKPPQIPVVEQEPPKVEITRAPTDDFSPPVEEVKEIPVVNLPEPAAVKPSSRPGSPAQDQRRRRHEDNIAKYCNALGVEVTLLEGTGGNFDEILTDLGWNGRLSDDQKIEDLEADIRREIGRVQATSWLGNIEQQEGKIDQLARLIDRTVEECEELDGLLTLYSHELGTLHDDVAYIEAQSQGLQVQTANQKLLQNELQNLLDTLSISPEDLRPLKEASFKGAEGVRVTEAALAMLYKAMVTIDSDIRQNKKRMADAAGDSSSIGVYADTEVVQMRAIREKKDEYRTEADAFLQRLRQFMSTAFKAGEQTRIDTPSSSKDALKLDNTPRNAARQEMWMYNALMLFAREVGTTEWTMIINLYEQDNKAPYQNQFRNHCASWKKAVKKVSGDETELLFTHHEKDKESDGITTAARKLTVRRGKTVRVQQGQRSIEKPTGRLEPYEVFTGALQETLKMISQEQNFVVHFFHLNSLATVEFSDIITANEPGERQIPDFSVRQLHDPDRDLAKRVEQIMDSIFSFWATDIQNLVDWVLKTEQLQGIGVLAALEGAISEYDDSNQDFIVHTLQKLLSRLNGLFNRFVDEQIRGIEETKVKINKRKGVISFMRTFPHFSTVVENMLASQASSSFSDVRVSVNEAYTKINRAMWESLKFIAKEAPGQAPGTTTGVGDPEDKEALNYHILLIENMNHYLEEVDVRDLPVLERWRDRAFQDYHEHMKLYMDAVIRRPLGKLLDFVESTESLLANTSSPTDISKRTSHSRHVAKKLISSYDSKELRRGADLLKKRVEKHFGDADDPGLSRSLVAKVLKECESRYADAYDRTRKVIDSVYEGQIELEWNRDEIAALFRR